MNDEMNPRVENVMSNSQEEQQAEELNRVK